MGKKHFKRLGLALSAALLCSGLTSCGGNIDGTCYFFDNGDSYADGVSYSGIRMGDFIGQITTTLQSGTIVSASLKETYSPCVWARVDKTAAEAAGVETVDIEDIYAIDGSKSTVSFAKHIKIDDWSFTGSIRDVLDTDAGNDTLFYRGETIVYTYDKWDKNDDKSGLNDLHRFLNISDSDLYKLGTNLKWYFDAIESDNFSILKTTTAATEDVAGVYDKSTMDPYFPEGKKYRGECSTYSKWNSAMSGLTDWLKDKKMNFQFTVKDEDDNNYRSLKAISNVWNYNPEYINGVFDDANYLPITGCNRLLTGSDGSFVSVENSDGGYTQIYLVSDNSIISLFTAINRAFASVEYESKK